MAKGAREVIGIEYVPEAIVDAKENARINGLENTKFFAGDMKDILTDDFIARHGHPDVIITDPPRAGMHPDVVSVILNAAPQRIVYVSCNPATQARDLSLLDADCEVAGAASRYVPAHAPWENVVQLLRRSVTRTSADRLLRAAAGGLMAFVRTAWQGEGCCLIPCHHLPLPSNFLIIHYNKT